MVKVKGRKGHWTLLPVRSWCSKPASFPLWNTGPCNSAYTWCGSSAGPCSQASSMVWVCHCCGFLHHTLRLQFLQGDPTEAGVLEGFCQDLASSAFNLLCAPAQERGSLPMFLLAWSPGESPGLGLAGPHVIRVLEIRLSQCLLFSPLLAEFYL